MPPVFSIISNVVISKVAISEIISRLIITIAYFPTTFA